LVHLSVCLPVHIYETTWERWDSFFWAFLFGSFAKVFWHTPLLVQITGTLNEDLYVFVHTEVITHRCGISRVFVTVLLQLPWLKIIDQILMNVTYFLWPIYVPYLVYVNTDVKSYVSVSHKWCLKPQSIRVFQPFAAPFNCNMSYTVLINRLI
jgi:hypothetical protein